MGITRLTGIDDKWSRTPHFSGAAQDLLEFLGDAVLSHTTSALTCGYLQAASRPTGCTYNPRRLCTVRMSRKWIEGPQRYSLGALCAFFGIDNEAHHRAWGDAAATADAVFQAVGRPRRRDSRGDWPRDGDSLGGHPTCPQTLWWTCLPLRGLSILGRIRPHCLHRNEQEPVLSCRQHFNNASNPRALKKLRRKVASKSRGRKPDRNSWP